MRGIGFNDAAVALNAIVEEWQDTRHDYGEKRIVARCWFGEVLLIVVYTRRGDSIHIISARRANRKERRLV
jgi:uncharacterized DUF497 family protein